MRRRRPRKKTIVKATLAGLGLAGLLGAGAYARGRTYRRGRRYSAHVQGKRILYAKNTDPVDSLLKNMLPD